MIISLSVVRRPRVQRFCEGCYTGFPHSIEGPAIRLYGAAHHGDKPYVLWICEDAARHGPDTAERMTDLDLDPGDDDDYLLAPY